MQHRSQPYMFKHKDLNTVDKIGIIDTVSNHSSGVSFLEVVVTIVTAIGYEPRRTTPDEPLKIVLNFGAAM